MRINDTNFTELYSYADYNAFTEAEETTLIGLTLDKINEILTVNKYETLESIDKFFRLDNWERSSYLKELKKTLKHIPLDKQFELFYYLGQLQGQKEMWHLIENK